MLNKWSFWILKATLYYPTTFIKILANVKRLSMSLKYVNGGVMRVNHKNHLDAYYTKPKIAKQLFNTTQKIIAKYENLDKYTWLEPSVGEGCFYNLLPESKIGWIF
ncbi:hypothetical protein NHP190012_04100 [Helicobacter sp. NHP19-012]|uniref:Uncharacterized protein n=1 Tax=Helicobacter gastrofelis TaxID=2849642 RepID=A0ABM7SGV1_9HELI|nr:hypothetical protein [Helicobacter sp. NHP19-012]BCZ18768.1 hypothetical protein NHP190012_04100 [Helicobacter sp. NHP19-012]